MLDPDLTNQIIGVMFCLKQEKVAFMDDIEAMFYQVRIPPEHRSYLRFLWWKNRILMMILCLWRCVLKHLATLHHHHAVTTH